MDDQEDLFADLYEGDADDAKAPLPATAPAAVPAPVEQVEQPQVAPAAIAPAQVPVTSAIPAQSDSYDDDSSKPFDPAAGAPREEPSYEDKRDRPVQLKDDGKMFIGGLNWETTDQSMKDYFSQFGEVIECTVMRDGSTGRSRGFGFLRFADPKVVNVVAVKEHILDGKLIDPKRAIPRDEQEKTSKIFVGGVSQDANEQDFKKYFEQFGRVLDATLMMDKDTGRPRGFGFVTFDSDTAVDRTLDGPLEILGKPIEVKRAQPRNAVGDEEGSGRGGRFGGRGRGGAQNNFGGSGANAMSQAQQLPAQGAAPAGMSPAQMAQYWMQMQNMMKMVQQSAMQNNPQMQHMQQMMAMQNNPQLMQQMMAMQQANGGMPQSNTPVNGGQQGNAQQQDNYERQQQARMQQSNFNGGNAWEGMYDDEAPPGSRGGRNNRGGATPNAPLNAPINAPTGPKHAGRGSGYRGGGRGGHRGGYHPYGRPGN